MSLGSRIDRIERALSGVGPSVLAIAWCRQFGGDPREITFRTMEELVTASYQMVR